MSQVKSVTKVDEYGGWEIHRAAPSSFSIRRAGQTFGPYASVAEAREAIDAEEGRPRDQPGARRDA